MLFLVVLLMVTLLVLLLELLLELFQAAAGIATTAGRVVAGDSARTIGGGDIARAGVDLVSSLACSVRSVGLRARARLDFVLLFWPLWFSLLWFYRLCRG